MITYNAFKTKVTEYLGSKYKEKILHIYRDGKWRNKLCIHILPEENKKDNFLFDAQINDKNELIIENEKVKLHRYWYHLNSSQVMCINFFNKLITEEGKEILLKIIKHIITLDDDVSIEKAIFEYEPDNIEKTNFDFYIKLSNNMQIFWEIKYTEDGFGKAKADDLTRSGITHKTKFEKVYKQNLSETLNFKNEKISCENFLNDYQINRNVFYVKNKKDFSFFLIPEDNKKTCEQLDKVIGNFENVYKIYWEELYEIVKKEIGNKEELNTYYNKFYEKYFGYKMINE